MFKVKLSNITQIANSPLLPNDIVVMLSACIGKVYSFESRRDNQVYSDMFCEVGFIVSLSS